MNRFIIAAALAATTLSAAPALADPPSWAPAHGRRAHNAEYDRYGRYAEPRPLTSRDRVWRGRDGRYYCKRSNGTTGLVIGAVGGALVGRTIDTRGDRTLGTLLGAAGGALLGREIERSGSRCR
ncbi:glycine zipper 2TM domain-containing protein [Novosphingobium sp.]|uniref:glycine zipper 2TM domain-containing protein n=1 Tax=Novosphingobium sp. TaxID=1874826 RepID=UPI002627C8C4|nr:glycine zipper 2TM domain-containing protein [Novosphingobium sp.]